MIETIMKADQELVSDLIMTKELVDNAVWTSIVISDGKVLLAHQSSLK